MQCNDTEYILFDVTRPGSVLWAPPVRTVCKVTLILSAVNRTPPSHQGAWWMQVHWVSCSPCVPFMLGCSLSEPVHTGLHTAHGVSSVQEVGDRSVFQSLIPSRPLCVCQPWDQTFTNIRASGSIMARWHFNSFTVYLKQKQDMTFLQNMNVQPRTTTEIFVFIRWMDLKSNYFLLICFHSY